MNGIAQNIGEVRQRMARAAAESKRAPDGISLVAVSKTVPAEVIENAVAAGQRCFGENRIQEAEPKIIRLRRQLQLEWHLVGHLQSNKAHRAAELFDVVHSLDSIKLATRLSQACQETGKVLSVLMQVDLAREATKHGADTSQVRELLAAASELKGIRLNGLMILPPFFEDPEQVRPYFKQLRELRDDLERERPGSLGLQHLSMGMTHDFEIAIQEGATLVRIGTAIFGARNHG